MCTKNKPFSPFSMEKQNEMKGRLPVLEFQNNQGGLKTVQEFLNNVWGLGTELEQGCRTGPPGYTAWRNWLLGIDSWAP